MNHSHHAYIVIVSSLHCHKCNKEQHGTCAKLLGNDKFLQLCPEDYEYCAMIWTKEEVLKRGCNNGTVCDEYKGDDETSCCYCQKDGCNYGAISCNGQDALDMEFLLIVVMPLVTGFKLLQLLIM